MAYYVIYKRGQTMINRIKDFKIASKITVLISIVMFINIIIFTIILFKTSSLNLKTSKEFSIEYSKNQSQEISRNVKETELIVLQTINSIESLRKSGNLSREEVINLLASNLHSNDAIVALATLWEENAFDGKDNLYKNKQYHDETGRFIPYIYKQGKDIGVEALHNYEVEGEGDWYLIPKKTKKTLLTEPYYYNVNGKEILMATISIPILDENNKFLGIVTADIGLTYIQDTIKELKPLGGYSFIVSQEGTYVANGKDQDMILKNIFNNEDIDEKGIDYIKNGKSEAYFYKDIKTNKEFLKTFESIHIKSTDKHWSFITVIPKSEIASETTQLSIFTIIMCILIILITTLSVFILAKDILKPIKYLKYQMKKVEEGNLILEEPLDRKDEFGELSHSFSNMTSKTLILIKKLKDATEKIDQSAYDLSDISKVTVEAAVGIADVMSEIATCAVEQSKEVEEVSDKNLELARQIEEISNSSSRIKNEADRASKISENGVRSIDILEEVAKETNQYSQAVSKVASKLEAQSGNIGQIVEVINEISEQTSLLALNAAIEAARAGESGRGFAVVASEIKKLAEQSKNSTEKIGNIVRQIQEEIKNMFKSMDKSNEIMDQNGMAVENAKEVFADIISFIEALAMDIGEINLSINSINNSKELMVESIIKISNVAGSQAASSEEVNATTEENKETISRIDNSVKELNELCKLLNDEISRFKVE